MPLGRFRRFAGIVSHQIASRRASLQCKGNWRGYHDRPKGYSSAAALRARFLRGLKRKCAGGDSNWMEHFSEFLRRSLLLNTGKTLCRWLDFLPDLLSRPRPVSAITAGGTLSCASKPVRLRPLPTRESLRRHRTCLSERIEALSQGASDIRKAPTLAACQRQARAGVCGDEARVGQGPGCVDRWLARGASALDSTTIGSVPLIFSAVRFRTTKDVHTWSMPSVNAKVMDLFLAHFAAGCARRHDPAPVGTKPRPHRPDNVTLALLPPYSPELNPVERVSLYRTLPIASASSTTPTGHHRRLLPSMDRLLIAEPGSYANPLRLHGSSGRRDLRLTGLIRGEPVPTNTRVPAVMIKNAIANTMAPARRNGTRISAKSSTVADPTASATTAITRTSKKTRFFSVTASSSIHEHPAFYSTDTPCPGSGGLSDRSYPIK